MIAKAKDGRTTKKKRLTAQERRAKRAQEIRVAERERRRQEWLAGVATRKAEALRLLAQTLKSAEALRETAFKGVMASHLDGQYSWSVLNQSPEGSSDLVIWGIANAIRQQILTLLLAGDPATPGQPSESVFYGRWDLDSLPSIDCQPAAVALDGVLWQALPGAKGGMILTSTWDVPVERLD